MSSVTEQWLLRAAKRAGELAAERQHVRRRLKEETTALAEAEARVAAALEATKVVQQVAETVQAQAHARIAQVVTRCLSAVFEDPYEFRILFEQKRGRTEARLVFVDGEQELDPLTAVGGGVVDIAAFALRLAALLLHQPPLRRILIADEPFRFVSAEYRDRVRVLLENLHAELGVQFIIVTHITELETGTVVRL